MSVHKPAYYLFIHPSLTFALCLYFLSPSCCSADEYDILVEGRNDLDRSQDMIHTVKHSKHRHVSWMMDDRDSAGRNKVTYCVQT